MDKEEGLTAVLYPHRRIKITELIKAGRSGSSGAAVVECRAGRCENRKSRLTLPPWPYRT